jgi:hypothetical protein
MLYYFPPYRHIAIFLCIKLLLSNEGAVDVVGVYTAKPVTVTNQPDHEGDSTANSFPAALCAQNTDNGKTMLGQYRGTKSAFIALPPPPPPILCTTY